MYETWLMEQIHSIANFPYEDIKILDKYPLDVSKQVLKVLIENSCLGQNYGPIDISRKKINEINKDCHTVWEPITFFPDTGNLPPISGWPGGPPTCMSCTAMGMNSDQECLSEGIRS